MPRSAPSSVTDAVCVLASPGSVLALVVLALNDQVLKEAWPGVVTGKLSDVAGLVFAPLLLGVLLTAVRVPRAMTVALAATGAGFVFCKTSAVGAAVTSSVWSLLGTPTMIRADVTDLVALPALYLSWRIRRSAMTRVGAGWRRTVSAAVGIAVLPFGVLATSATSCDSFSGYTEVAVLQGDFDGLPVGVETRLAVESEGSRITIDGTGTFARSTFRIAGDRAITRNDLTCAGRRCWRFHSDDRVEVSTDGGGTWDVEDRLDEADRKEIEDEIGDDEECGDPPRVGPTDIAAMEVGGTVRVVVSLQRGGIWHREQDGTWTVLTPGELYERVEGDVPAPPVVTELDRTQQPREPDVGSPTPTPTPTPAPSPSCPSPTPTTVTPNPSNGPPTTYDVCP